MSASVEIVTVVQVVKEGSEEGILNSYKNLDLKTNRAIEKAENREEGYRSFQDTVIPGSNGTILVITRAIVFSH